MWLASPALPAGGFSYSEALEAAVDSGRVGNEAEGRALAGEQLQLALGRSELPLLAQAIAAWRTEDAVCARAQRLVFYA